MARNDLKGKVVLMAGGGKNLGGLLSRSFAAKGAKLAIHYNSESSLIFFDLSTTSLIVISLMGIMF